MSVWRRFRKKFGVHDLCEDCFGSDKCPNKRKPNQRPRACCGKKEWFERQNWYNDAGGLQ